MSNRNRVEVVLSLVDKGFRGGFARVTKSISAFNREANNGVRVITALEGAVAGMVGAFLGMQALRSGTEMMQRAADAGFNLEASLRAASREFSGIGTGASWGDAIDRLSAKLRVYSDTELKNAASRTIDMTKRLGLSAEQMERVIELTGDLSAGKTSLEGGIERVTAALRGEAEASEYLGLTLNENYVKAWYQARGAMQGAWKDLTDLQKAQVRYQVFVEQAAPMQGRAAESVKTFSGALALARKEIENAVSRNNDAVSAMKDLAGVIRDNADELGQLVSRIVTAAARTAEWVLRNKEMVLSIGEWTVKIYLLFKAFQVLGAAGNILKGINASVTMLTGSSLVSWLKDLGAAFRFINNDVGILGKAFMRLSTILLSFKAGWEIGGWLNQFDVVKKAGITMARYLTIAFLRVKKAWAWATGGDTAAIQREIDEAKRIYSEMFADVGKKAAQAGEKVSASSRQAAEAAKQSSAQQSQVTGKALEEMKKKYRQYADEVMRLQEQISGRSRSLAEQLRAMARTGMSDINAWRDRKREAEEYERAAKKAAEAGDFKDAVKLADKARAAYADLNREVKDGDRVLVSQQYALRTSMDGVKRAGELAIDALKKQQAAAKDAMDELTAKSGFQDLEKGMDESKKKWLDNWRAMQAAAMDELDKVERRIRKIVTDQHMTIYVDEVVRRAAGGLIRRFATGGRLPGYGGGDRIPALLEAGEYIIRKEAVSRFGAGIFHALNNLRLPELPKFATGGPVAAGSGASGETININLTMPTGTYPVRTDRMTADRMLRDLARMQRLRSS